MAIQIIFYIILLIVLIIASYTDLKTREVPDWLNYGLIIMGLSLNLIASIVFNNYSFFINSIAGFIAFLLLGYLMFYTGQWGGGDSKAIMGIGALLGLDISLVKFPFLISLLINIFLIGAVYGLLWSGFLALKSFNSFRRPFYKMIQDKKFIKIRNYSLAIFISLAFILLFIKDFKLVSTLILLDILIFTMIYLWAFIKSVEKACMMKYVKPEQLTEGDWIVKDISYKGRKIVGPNDLGINMSQIRQLIKLYRAKKIKNILIKEGIPFVPSFLLGYVASLILLYFFPQTYGNIIFSII